MATEQVEPPPADWRNEQAADMITRRGEEQAIREQAMAMTRDALREVVAGVTGPHTVEEMRQLASRPISDNHSSTGGTSRRSTRHEV